MGTEQIDLQLSRWRNVWVHDDTKPEGGFWNPPLPHVIEGVNYIVDKPYVLLADDMGLSKTAQAIISAQVLSDAGLIDRVIVVATAAIRPKVWFDEDLGQLKEQLWFGKRNMITEYHSKLRQWIWEPKGDKELRWLITNYEYIRDEANLHFLFQFCGPKTFLILDESSAVRGHDSAQTRACMLLRWKSRKTKSGKLVPILGNARCGRILQMNGTPLADSPLDLFSQGNLLHPSILDCKFVTHYKARYAVQESVLTFDRKPLKDKWGREIKTIKSGAEGWTNLEDLQQRFAPYVLRREAKSVGIDFALPPVALEVRLKESTWRLYRDMRDEMVAWLKSGVATASTAAVRGIRLSQLTSGFIGGVEKQEVLGLPPDVEPSFVTDLIEEIGDGDGPIREVSREKLDFAIEWHASLLRKYPDLKLVTWCRFVPELKRYLHEERLTFPAIPVGVACGQKIFAGEHSQKSEREYALRLLHPKTAPEGPATVGATQGTGALGLNFTACRTVLDMSYDFSPWKKRQGDARFNRQGQTGPVSFFYIVAVGPKGQKTIDHHIIMTRLGKLKVNDWTVSGWLRNLEQE